MFFLNDYFGVPMLAAMNAKTEQEQKHWNSIYEARKQEYKDKKLSPEQNPDGTWPEIDENY